MSQTKPEFFQANADEASEPSESISRDDQMEAVRMSQTKSVLFPANADEAREPSGTEDVQMEAVRMSQTKPEFFQANADEASEPSVSISRDVQMETVRMSQTESQFFSANADKARAPSHIHSRDDQMEAVRMSQTKSILFPANADEAREPSQTEDDQMEAVRMSQTKSILFPANADEAREPSQTDSRDIQMKAVGMSQTKSEFFPANADEAQETDSRYDQKECVRISQTTSELSSASSGDPGSVGSRRQSTDSRTILASPASGDGTERAESIRTVQPRRAESPAIERVDKPSGVVPKRVTRKSRSSSKIRDRIQPIEVKRRASAEGSSWGTDIEPPGSEREVENITTNVNLTTATNDLESAVSEREVEESTPDVELRVTKATHALESIVGGERRVKSAARAELSPGSDEVRKPIPLHRAQASISLSPSPTRAEDRALKELPKSDATRGKGRLSRKSLPSAAETVDLVTKEPPRTAMSMERPGPSRRSPETSPRAHSSAPVHTLQPYTRPRSARDAKPARVLQQTPLTPESIFNTGFQLYRECWNSMLQHWNDFPATLERKDVEWRGLTEAMKESICKMRIEAMRKKILELWEVCFFGEMQKKQSIIYNHTVDLQISLLKHHEELHELKNFHEQHKALFDLIHRYEEHIALVKVKEELTDHSKKNRGAILLKEERRRRMCSQVPKLQKTILKALRGKKADGTILLIRGETFEDVIKRTNEHLERMSGLATQTPTETRQVTRLSVDSVVTSTQEVKPRKMTRASSLTFEPK